MNVVVLGAQGFVGKNLVLFLEKAKGLNVRTVSRSTSVQEFDEVLIESDIVINLAGVNRPSDGDFSENFTVVERLIDVVSKSSNKPRLFHLSSTKASDPSDYGKSKALAEVILEEATCFSEKMIYRAPNIYGKWCRPDYNSFIATCVQNLHDNVEINFQDNPITLIYIDDLCEGIFEFIQRGTTAANNIFEKAHHATTVKTIVETLRNFKKNSTIQLPDVRSLHDKNLYATFQSALQPEKFVRTYAEIGDERGSFSEIFKGLSGGQISINKTTGNAIKGNHWHNTKCEKFLPVDGQIIVKFKHMITRYEFELEVSSDMNQVIDIPPGYAHSMRNAKPDATTRILIWANEEFDHDRPDTIRELI